MVIIQLKNALVGEGLNGYYLTRRLSPTPGFKVSVCSQIFPIVCACVRTGNGDLHREGHLVLDLRVH